MEIHLFFFLSLLRTFFLSFSLSFFHWCMNTTSRRQFSTIISQTKASSQHPVPPKHSNSLSSLTLSVWDSLLFFPLYSLYCMLANRRSCRSFSSFFHFFISQLCSFNPFVVTAKHSFKPSKTEKKPSQNVDLLLSVPLYLYELHRPLKTLSRLVQIRMTKVIGNDGTIWPRRYRACVRWTKSIMPNMQGKRLAGAVSEHTRQHPSHPYQFQKHKPPTDDLFLQPRWEHVPASLKDMTGLFSHMEHNNRSREIGSRTSHVGQNSILIFCSARISLRKHLKHWQGRSAWQRTIVFFGKKE